MLRLLILHFLLLASGFSQMLFTAPNGNATSLFQQTAAGVSVVNTGFVDHRGLGFSRDGRFAIFGAVVDGNQGGTLIPSADVFEFDRATNRTRKLIDFHATIGGFFNNVSNGLSLDNRFVAVASEIFLRFGIQANSSGRILEVYDRATGNRVSDVTAIRGGAVDDGLNLEFSAISWSPRAPSFATSFYVPVPGIGGIPSALPAIVRFDRDASGQWVPSQALSTPVYLTNQFPPAASAQAFPSYSPSGVGLAYFSIFYPDVIGGSVGAQASVVVANADGSGARVLTTFNSGLLPTGLTWSSDGNQLVVSIAPQQNLGTGFLNSPVVAQSVIRAVATSNGAITQLPGIDNGLTPQVAVNAAPPSQNLSGLTPILKTTSLGLLLSALGLDPAKNYRLLASSTLSGAPTTTEFTGAQLATGVPISTDSKRRFFQIQSLP